MKRVLAFVLGLLLLGWRGAALAGPEASTPEQVVQGTGSVLATLVYSPLKASFCILGGVASAFTAIASPSTAGKVVGTSCGGTWMITPDVLKGREQVKFVGNAHCEKCRHSIELGRSSAGRGAKACAGDLVDRVAEPAVASVTDAAGSRRWQRRTTCRSRTGTPGS